MEKTIRVLIAKPGLDGHDRGAKIIAKYLRDSGMEVIYTGLRQTPEMIVNTAVQEDVDLIGLSVLSGAHNHLCRKLFAAFREKGIEPPLVFLGGIIPEEDFSSLYELGIKAIFPPGSRLEEVRNRVREMMFPGTTAEPALSGVS